VQQSRAYGCSAVYAQCGGADPGVTTAWSGPFCCPVRAQRQPLHSARRLSTRASQEATECVFFSNSFSQCKPCNAVYEQWCEAQCVLGRMRESCRLTAPSAFPRSGGTIPGTDVPWAGHGRPACCAAGSSCRYVNNNFYQCQPNASG
jgi:hypothetical protein